METERTGKTQILTDNDLIKVLLVEDDAVERRLVERLLSRCLQPVEFAVEPVGSLPATVECLGSKEYDIVLLDLGLSDSNGIETVRKVSEVNPRLPIVVLTGLDDEEIGLSAIKNGAADYLVKSQSLENLLVRTIRFALERKQAEEALQASEANLRKVIVASPDGIVIVDRDGIVQFVNPAAESLFGRRAEELLGELFGFPVMRGEVIEVDIVNHGGGPGIAEMRVVETVWNGQSAYMALLRDITERKLAEEKLKEVNEKLKEYNQLKDEFVSTASHELRTPLSIIMGAIRLVLDEIPGKIVEEQRDVLATAMESVNRLTRIVDSLLTISKIESGKLDLQRTVVNICELVKNTVSDYKALAQEKDISLDYDVPEEGIDICLDLDRTKEILINLISNSIKFTPEGGWIKVTCNRLDEEVQLSVQDSGIGIAKEDEPKLFDKFTQFGRKAGPGEKGTGLGLAIVKKLVEMHGGRIEVESEVDQGTTFTISLPLTVKPIAEGLPAETDELVENTLAGN